MSQEKSKFLQLNGRDFLNGLLMAVLAVVIGGAYTLISATPGEYGSGSDWLLVLHSGVVTAVSYLVKNLFTGNGEEK